MELRCRVYRVYGLEGLGALGCLPSPLEGLHPKIRGSKYPKYGVLGPKYCNLSGFWCLEPLDPKYGV